MGARRAAAPPKILPLTPVPLQTLVVNVTNQCNLSCTYCYEYGEDKIVDTENGKQPKFMSEETARERGLPAARVARQPRAHMTFFGGETLMNFPVLKSTIAYARAARAEVGKEVDFSLTTNATLLRPEVIEFLAENASASRSRSTARRSCRTSSASSTTARAATTWSRRRSRRCWRGIARARSARA